MTCRAIQLRRLVAAGEIPGGGSTAKGREGEAFESRRKTSGLIDKPAITGKSLLVCYIAGKTKNQSSFRTKPKKYFEPDEKTRRAKLKR